MAGCQASQLETSHASKQIESRCEKWHLPYGQPFVNYDHNLFDQYKGSGTADPLESLGEAKPSRAQVSGRHVFAVPYHMKGLGGMLMIMIHDIKEVRHDSFIDWEDFF